MAHYTKRIQAVLSQKQHDELLRLSKDCGKPVSVLVREAVEEVYFQEAEYARRQKALAKLTSLEAPVGEWDDMEREIVEGSSR